MNTVTWQVIVAPAITSGVHVRALIWRSATSGVNVMLAARTKPYVKLGRSQDEDEARRIDDRVRSVLERYQVPYQTVPGDRDAPATIFAAIQPPATGG